MGRCGMAIGPQKAAPASDARIRAQQKQLEKQMAEAHNDRDVGDYCDSCGYALIKKPSIVFCSKCFKTAR